MRLPLLLSSTLFLGGCSTWFARQEFKDQLYRQNILFKVNGKDVEGLGVVSRETKYKIEAWFPKGDFVKIQSCQGDTIKEGDGGHTSFDYEPSEIEREKYCPLEFFSLENKRGRRGFGILLFRTPGYGLGASLSCGWENTQGADLACQAQAGSAQLIEVKEPVVWAGKAIKSFEGTKCELVGNGQRFEIPVSHGICFFTFIAKSDFNKRAQLYLLGYKGYVVEE